MDDALLSRAVVPGLIERLDAMPALVVTGARQTGKSTLTERLLPGKRRYHSLDDLDILDVARRDPDALLGDTDPVRSTRSSAPPNSSTRSNGRSAGAARKVATCSPDRRTCF